MVEGVKEQRRYPRIPSHFHLLVRPDGHWDDETFTRTEDVGLGGCQFTHTRALPEGTRLFMAIAIKERIVEVGGRVVYATPRQDGGFDTGVEFTRFRPSDRECLVELFVNLETRPGLAP